MPSFPKQWLALYTRSRWEKKVYQLLIELGHEAFLPLRRERRQWKDRKKWVEEPLIRSYVFVYTGEKEYYDILNIPGAVRYIFFEGKPAPIREDQLELLKKISLENIEAIATEEQFSKGDEINISSGILTGYSGELVDFKGNKKVLVRLDQLGQSLLLTIPLQNIMHKIN